MLKINPTQPLILAIQQIRIIPPNRLQPIFTIPTQKSIKLLLAFLNLFQHAKNQLNSSIYSWDKADFRTLWHKKPCPFLTTPTQKLLKLFLTSLNLYLHAQIYSIHHFILEIKQILESNDLKSHPHLWTCLTKYFSINFKFHGSVSACKKQFVLTI